MSFFKGEEIENYCSIKLAIGFIMNFNGYILITDGSFTPCQSVPIPTTI